MSLDMVEQQDGLWLKGDLTFATIQNLLEQSQRYFANKTTLNIHLSELQHCDSAGVALLLKWLRQAKENKQTILYLNPHSQLQKLIALCELKSLLPIKVTEQ